MINVISSEEETYARCKTLLTSEAPSFLARIGGSDTNASVGAWNEPNNADRRAFHITRVEEYNGFYSVSTDKTEDYDNYIATMDKCYRGVSDAFAVCPYMLTLYYPHRIPSWHHWKRKTELNEYDGWMNAVPAKERTLNLLPYDFIERITSHEYTFLHLLSEILPGKKVLVVSPFGQSIRAQEGKWHTLFKNYNYPEFDLITYETPITYSGLPAEMYPDHNWCETTERMQSDISKLDFDIALLCCGSYAMPIGTYIRDVCRRHSVYVGGTLQLFFGVMGRRWAAIPSITDQMNIENFIYPLEAPKFTKHIKISKDTPGEAFGAYL